MAHSEPPHEIRPVEAQPPEADAKADAGSKAGSSDADAPRTFFGRLRSRGVTRAVDFVMLGYLSIAVILGVFVWRAFFVAPPKPAPPMTAARFAAEVGGGLIPGHCRLGPGLSGGRIAVACECPDGRHAVGVGIPPDWATEANPWHEVDVKCGAPDGRVPWRLDPLTLGLSP